MISLLQCSNDNDDEIEELDDDADLYVTIHHFTAQQKGDLSFKLNEILDILHKK